MRGRPSNARLPYLVAVIGVALWQGMIGVMVRWIAWPSVATVWARCFVAAAVLLPLGWWARSGERRPTRSTWLAIVVSGLLLAGHWVTLIWGFRVAKIGPVIVAGFSFPVMASLVEPWFFGARPQPRQVLLAVLVAAGITGMHVFGESDNAAAHDNSLGIVLGVVSAAFFTARNILCRKIRPYTGPVLMMGLQAAVVAVVLSPSLATVGARELDPRQLWLLACFGVAFTALPHTVLIWAFERLSVAASGIVGSLQVLSAMLLAWIYLDERITVVVALGATAVVCGVAWESAVQWHRGRALDPGARPAP